MTRLQQLRLDDGLSLGELSSLSKVAVGTIRRIEAGKGGQAAPLAKLSTYFGVPASDLVRDALPVTERSVA